MSVPVRKINKFEPHQASSIASTNIIAHPTRSLTPADLPNIGLPAQIRRINMCPPTRINLRSNNLNHPKLFPRWRQTPTRHQPLQPILLKILFIPPINLDRHRLIDVLIYPFLNSVFPLPFYEALELARCRIGEM